MVEPYESLAVEIEKSGFFATSLEHMGDWNRVTIPSQRRPGGGYAGNSFWLTYLSGKFYLGTGGGMLYQLPDDNRVIELCVDWLSRESEQTKADFDEDLRNKFDLVETSVEDFDEVAGETLGQDQ